MIRRHLLLMLAFSMAIAGGASAAKLEMLGQPCRAKNVLAARVVKDRATGREMFVLSNMNENSGAELIFVDFDKDTGKVYKAPAGAGAWGLLEVPGDRLIVSTFYDGVFMVFDLKEMAFKKVAHFPGESYIWNMAMGGDGRVYGGSYGNGKLGALDLKTYEVEDLGNPAPPNLYLRYVSGLPDGRILCYFNTEKPTTLIFDPATKKFGAAPTAISGGVPGVSWNEYFLNGRQVFDGKTLEEISPAPFPTPPSDKATWSFDINLTKGDTVYMRQGTAVYKYTKGDKDVTLVCDLNARNGGIYARSANGELLGVRGQDYFVVKPGDKELKLRRIPVESGPRESMFMRCDPKGILWGGPTFGQTLWHMDPKTKKTVNTANVSDHGGEVYDVAFANGKVYAVAYVGGEVIEYDPAQPWDQLNHKNPKTIAKVGPNYIRPEGGVALGPDGKLYAGWLAKYGTYGGAISITDPKTGQTELIENPLGEQGIVWVATDGSFVFAGSTLGANGLPNKKGESARFGMIDLATKKPVFQHEFPGSSHVRVLAYDPRTKRVALSVDGSPGLFDAAKRELLPVPNDIPAVQGRSIADCGDGTICYASGKSVVRWDIRTGKVSTVVEAPAGVQNVAVGPDGKLFVSCGVDVYAVR